jgi:hypothetical protein
MGTSANELNAGHRAELVERCSNATAAACCGVARLSLTGPTQRKSGGVSPLAGRKARGRRKPGAELPLRHGHNLAHDNYRRRIRLPRVHVTFEDLQIEADDPQPERVVDAERGKRIVDSALRDVQPRPRQAFLLYVQEEMTYECIALRLGVSKKTIERDIALLTFALCRSRLTRWSEA